MLNRQSDDIKKEEKDEGIEYGAVIVGAGLAGLTAAVELSQNGIKTLLIECRAEEKAFTRRQLIVLNNITISYLKSIYDKKINITEEEDKQDKEFFKKLNGDEDEHYEIKDIQQYLKRRIDPKHCSICYELAVTKINPEEGLLFISNKETVRFKNLILADGRKHSTANLLPDYIQYTPAVERNEKKHILGYFTVKSKDGKPIEIPMQRKFEFLGQGDCVGCIYYENSSYEQSNKTRLKLCVVMNLSDELYEKFKSNKIAGIEYLTHCVLSVFDQEKNNILITEKDCTTFLLTFEETADPAVNVGERIIISAGDARKTPDFYKGHGGGDAIICATNAALLVLGEISLFEYNVRCQEQSNTVSEFTALTNNLLFRLKCKAEEEKLHNKKPTKYFHLIPPYQMKEEKPSLTQSSLILFPLKCKERQAHHNENWLDEAYYRYK